MNEFYEKNFTNHFEFFPMTRFLKTSACCGIFTICMLSFFTSRAEGSKQLSPIVAAGDTSIVMLHTNADSTGNFAEYGGSVVSRMNIRIQDFGTETVYIGLSREYDDFGFPDGIGGLGTYCIRIIAPNGDTVHGPFSVNSGNANADSWLLATSGPDVLDPINGYDTGTEPYSTFIPTMNGDFSIEFTDNADCNVADPGDQINLKYFDFTVVSGGLEQQGRLWSLNWAFVSPPINPNTPPECQFDRSFNGVLFSYTTDGFVSKIDFDSSGFQGLQFTVAFGDRGPSNTGNVLLDRMSVNNADSTANAAVHMVFVNEPDEIEFPSSTSVCGEVALLGVQCVVDTFCFNVGITQPGQIEIILDFTGDGIFTDDTTDVILAVILDVADTVCINWNGLKGDGSPLGFGESLPAIIRYSQGVQHYAAYDVELLKFGFCVETVRPICPGVSTDLLYYDDTNISDDVNTPLYDESDPGTGQPPMQLNGCECQSMGCRTWTNVHIDNDTTCVGQITGYGDQNTLNTWWFASTTILGPLDLPFVAGTILGDSTICFGDSTEFIGMGTPDTMDFIYAWTGPNGFMANTQSTGLIADPGLYTVTITDTVSTCSFVDEITLVVFDVPVISLEFTCAVENQENADVNLTATGQPVLTFLWSNGSITEDLFNVPPDTYIVTVTDGNGCQAIDSITVEGCCVLDIDCPPLEAGQFSCIEDVPAPDTTVIIVNDYCDPLSISFIDVELSNGASGCIGDTIVLVRTYTIADGSGAILTCDQFFRIVDDVDPVINCPADVTVDCDAGIDPVTTGNPIVSDNCTAVLDLIVTYVDSGVPGTCADDQPVLRTWIVTDECGNTNSCVQEITVQDTVAPEIVPGSCPDDITINCDNGKFGVGSPSFTDNCTLDGSIVITLGEDSTGFDGTCINNVIGVVTFTFYAEDLCGNIDSSCIMTVTVQDTVAPTFTAPGDVTADCNADLTPSNTGEVTDTTDNCTTITLTFEDVIVPADCPALDSIFRTWTATDACGNSSTDVQIIVTFDFTAPTFTVPADVTIDCDGDTDPGNTGEILDTLDACGAAITVDFSDAIIEGGCDGESSIERTWIVSDECLNSSTAVQVITLIDTIGPSFEVPADTSVNCTVDMQSDFGSPGLITDNCSALTNVTFSDELVPGECPATDTLYRTWIVSDDCNNTSSQVQTITFIDTIAPLLISCPADATFDCATPADTLGLPTYLELCTGVSITFRDDSVGFTPPGSLGMILRTFFGTDGCGNVDSSCIQTIIIQDTLAPTVLTCPEGLTVECPTLTDTSLTGVPTYSDNCFDLEDLTLTFIDEVDPVGGACTDQTITRTFYITDPEGNVDSSCVQIITVEDDNAPTFIVPPSITVECDVDVDNLTLLGNVSNVLDCNAIADTSYTDSTPTGCNGTGLIIRSWVVTDVCGNSASAIQVITIQDTEGPTFTVPADVTLNCDEDPSDLGLTGDVTDEADACGSATIDFSDDESDLTGCNGTGIIIRSWIATDGCGNTNEQEQEITIEDATPPIALCQDITIDFGLIDEYILDPSEVDGGSSDNCGGVTLSLSQTVFECTSFIDGGSVTIQLTVTDECGLTDVCNVLVTGLGGGGLAIDCPDDITVHLSSGECERIVNYEVTASSLCGGPGNVITIEQVDDSGLTSGDFFPIGTTIQEYIAFNDTGDEVSCSFSITIVEGPEIPFPTCNNTVRISLDPNCQAHINPDVILEGGPYGCFDDFIICIEDIGCDTGVVIVTDPVLGCYSVTITNEAGNSCWGTICFEDKLPPQITCEDVTLNCGASTDPVFISVIEGSASASSFPGTAIGPGAGIVTTQVLQISAPTGAQVTDVNITIDLDHTWSEDLDVFLIAPNGASVELATDVCGTDDNWDNLTFDDEAGTSVTLACVGGTPTLSGSVRPEGFLNNFDGLSASGTWTLQINDDTDGDAGILNFVSIDIDYLVALPYAPSASDACGEVTLDYSDEESGELCENIIITRTWTATDGAGNTASCIQTITIVPLTLVGLEFPPTYIGICGESSHPGNTGWPTLDGVEINEFLCNIFLTWEDHPLGDCGGGNKIVRTWTLLDWCTLEIIEGEQIIKLTDEQAPVLTCPADHTVGSDPWFCFGNVILQVPFAVDICGTPFTLTPSISAGILVHFGGTFYRVDQLPVGTHTITWTAEDACGNVSTCSYDITVVDDVPPVPICDEHTVLTLTDDDGLDEGLTKLYATTLDDGSHDNCGPVTFLARRMASCIDFDWIGPNGEYPNNDGGIPEAIDLGLTFQEWVPFACCDAGQTIMVELRVTDLAGNVNSCMVEVYVQDKLPPLVLCPPDITVSCEYWFDAHETDGFEHHDGLEDHFGRVLDEYDYDESDREYIIINDPGNHELSQPYHWGLDGWADDNCDVTIDVRTRLFDDCSGNDLPGDAPDNAVRLVERTFRAQDQQGNTSTCRQRIWVVDFDPFYISDTQCGLNNADDVRWPCDLVITDCPEGYLTPENLSDYAPNNRPIVNDDNCSVVGVTYEDQVFYFVDGACFKIVRTWTVIDWCQFELNGEGGHYGYWTYVQVIKVNDHTGALFTDCPTGPITLCVEDEGITLPANNQVFLGESNPNSSACSVHVLMTRTVFEACSDELIYDVKVYPFNGLDYVQVLAPTHVAVDSNNEAILIFNTEQNSLPSNHPIRRYGLPYNDRFCSNYPLPGGSKDYHRILWSVEDGCGNLSTCSYLFRLEDCKKPTPICVGLSSVVMPSSGSVTIWAADFDSGSSVDDCTAHEDLLFSFSGDSYQPSKPFDCDLIQLNGSSTFILEIWVADEGNDQNCDGVISWAERNKDFCTTFIVIDDNEEVCPGGVGVAGEIETELSEPVELVTVRMTDQSGQLTNTHITDKNGRYQFGNALLTYTVEPGRNDNHKNGVSTLDLVEVQKHLLGIKPLTSPYKLIAADANNSESVSALDLVEIRSLILGLFVEFPRNTSWRFVDADFEFENPTSPWPFAEAIDLQNGMTQHEDFVGIKIGDINGTVTANAGQIQTRGARQVLKLQIDERKVKAGERVQIPVYGQDFKDIFGFQLTMKTEGLEYSGVEAGSIDMVSDYVASHDGAITMSWANLALAGNLGTSAGPSSVVVEPLFALSFTATTDGSLSDMLSITSDITEAEAYRNVADEDVELLDVQLTYETGEALQPLEYALYQNEPNPFSDQTVIGFDIPAAMSVTLTVYDMHGRVIRRIDGNYAQGFNEIVLKGKELKVAGAYYYRLNAGDFTASKKLILSRE